MLKYREHRSTLKESLATTKEFNTLSEKLFIVSSDQGVHGFIFEENN